MMHWCCSASASHLWSLSVRVRQLRFCARASAVSRSRASAVGCLAVAASSHARTPPLLSKLLLPKACFRFGRHDLKPAAGRGHRQARPHKTHKCNVYYSILTDGTTARSSPPQRAEIDADAHRKHSRIERTLRRMIGFGTERKEITVPAQTGAKFEGWASVTVRAVFS